MKDLGYHLDEFVVIMPANLLELLAPVACIQMQGDLRIMLMERHGERKATHVELHRACLQLVIRVLEFRSDLCLLHERLHLAKLRPLGHPLENASQHTQKRTA